MKKPRTCLSKMRFKKGVIGNEHAKVHSSIRSLSQFNPSLSLSLFFVSFSLYNHHHHHLPLTLSLSKQDIMR